MATLNDQDIDSILNIIKEDYGTLAWQIMDLLWQYHLKGKRISENKIAKLLNVDVHDVRKVLYLFQNQGVVFSKFWKINKKGWQINSWHIKEENLKKLLQKKDEENKKYDYFCPICGKKFTEDEALSLMYSCDSCSEILQKIESYEVKVENIKEQKNIIEELDY